MHTEMLAQADNQFNSRAYDGSRPLYKEALEAAEKAGDTSAQVEALAMIARTYSITKKQEAGRPWLERAAALATPAAPEGWSRFLGVRGRFEWQDEQTEAAIATFETMYAYCHERNLHSRALDAAHMLAIIGDAKQKIAWSLKAIAEAEAGKLDGWLGPLWNNLGWTYDDEKRYNMALDALLKAREHHYRAESALSHLIADWSVGHAQRMVGNHDEAEKILTDTKQRAKAMKADGNDHGAEWVGFSCKELGEIAEARGDIAQALASFECARENLHLAGMEQWDAAGFAELQTKLDALKGRQ